MRASTPSGSSHWPLEASFASEAADAGQAARELLLPHVDERHAHARGRGHLCDAGAHLPGADDHDALDHAPSTSITIASPCPPPEQIAARPRPPPRRRSS